MQFAIRQHHRAEAGTRRRDPLGQFRVLLGVALREPDRIGLVIKSRADHCAADLDVAGGLHVHGEAEPVE